MTDTAQAEVPATETAEVAETGSDDFTTEDIKRRFFSPEQLQDHGVPYINKIQSLGVPVKRNFDPQQDFPSGYGLGVIPISKRENEQNVLVSVAVCAIPDLALVANDEEGQKFIRTAVIDTFMNKAANAFRERADGTVAASAPYSLEDFITRRTRGESVKTFTTLAPHFVKALKQKGLKFLTAQLLRQILQSASFAGQIAATVPQEKWVDVLDIMIGKASEAGLDTQILENWKSTRNEAELQSIEDEDFTDLMELEIGD